ncbi:MAG TPA: hypothetical protein VGM70_02235 [Pseudolysinimonas sp.]|jgi:hypothetical protein
MPTEAELRERFHHDGDAAPGGDAIDLDAVLRRSRARRRPRVILTAVVSSLAVVGIAVPVSIGVLGSQLGSSSAGSAASAPDVAKAPQDARDGGAAAGGGRTATSAGTLSRCGAPLATPAPAADGLVLAVTPVDAAASARDIPVTVTLTNTGHAEISGSLSPFPSITFSQNGIVLWHSNGAVPQLAQVVDLDPGASTTFSTTFQPLVCGAADEGAAGFRAELPAAGAGVYGLSAALDVSVDGGSVLVTGPTAEATLH